jgi:2-polyprenyl-3-methyl-5-hydroxy-6-metoxy-1,4-benzoquinol methylase
MKDRLGFFLRIVLCRNCGIIRADPRISEDIVEIFYEKYYRKLISNELNEKSKKKELSKSFNRERLMGTKILNNIVKKYTPLKKGVVFDLGAGTGGMLYTFKNQGFETFGVDLNESFLKYGREKGINLKKGSINELTKYPKKANLIITSHILEHLHNLDIYLQKLWDCLEDNGYLYVELPGVFNQDSFLDFFVIEHLYYFTLLTLSKVLADNSFKLIVGNEKIKALFKKTHQKPYVKISSNYINNLLIFLRVYDIPLPLNYFNLIENKRKIKTRVILTNISILYRTKLINILAIIRKFFICCGIMISFK